MEYWAKAKVLAAAGPKKFIPFAPKSAVYISTNLFIKIANKRALFTLFSHSFSARLHVYFPIGRYVVCALFCVLCVLCG